MNTNIGLSCASCSFRWRRGSTARCARREPRRAQTPVQHVLLPDEPPTSNRNGCAPMTCSACRRENAADARFCSGCGTRLVEARSAEARDVRAYTPRHLAEKILTFRAALEGERKQVTVLFADVKGSMERSPRPRRARRRAGRPRRTGSRAPRGAPSLRGDGGHAAGGEARTGDRPV